jgi:hypothetical protein
MGSDAALVADHPLDRFGRRRSRGDVERAIRA